MARSTITAEEREFLETWENIAPYQNGIIKLNTRGDEVQEIVSGANKRFFITTEERMITQERVLDKRNDPFVNGSFRPVNVPDNVDIESNPNALSDEEIFEIFSASDVAWEEYMKVIDSPATLNRMVDLADEADGLTVRRLRQVQLRLREVKPPTRLTHNDDVLQKFLNDEATRKDGPQPAKERRGQGGRSAAYRDS